MTYYIEYLPHKTWQNRKKGLRYLGLMSVNLT